MTALLTGGVLVFGTVHIVADHLKRWPVTWWSKPATMLCVIALVAFSPRPMPGYAVLILLGLTVSLVGDVCLMLRPARFVAGLAAFLLAHLAYIGAFVGQAPPTGAGAASLLLVIGVVVYRLLRPGLGALRLPVLAYLLTILMMVWTAWSAWRVLDTSAAAAAAAGALLFLVSDASLGYARFRFAYPGAQIVTLSTYYAAQSLIALSAGPLRVVDRGLA